jgi:hypothetical protein
MQSRVQNALDDRKVELGQQMHLSPEEIDQLHDEDEEELEDTEDETEDEDETEEEELEDDEDIQPVSTES